MSKKVVWLTDLDIKGSGYRNLSIPLCRGLAERGHDVKAVGLKYKREEHREPFSIIPADNFQQSNGIIHNLGNFWNFDALIVALDIPVQEKIIETFPDLSSRYFGIFPVESDPLCASWAMVLQQMDKPFVISRFGTNEAHKAGVKKAEYLEVDIDSEAWKQPSKEERDRIRMSFGLSDDSFSVLTVADNQERKLLSRSMEIFADFLYDYNGVNAKIVKEEELEPKVDAQYSLVTREHNPVGWSLRDYAKRLGISNHLMIFERGIEFSKLWALYAMSDVFLLTSKAEGLGMPILEAMSVGLPCVGTNCTGIRENLSEGRGHLIDYDYVHVDPFGNTKRYFASREHGVEQLRRIYNGDLPDLKKAREYVEKRDWNHAVDKIHEELMKNGD